MTRAFAIRKCAYSLSRLVFEPSEHIVKPLVAKSLKEPLAIEKSIQNSSLLASCDEHIWTRKLF